jgi:hypothetical protein
VRITSPDGSSVGDGLGDGLGEGLALGEGLVDGLALGEGLGLGDWALEEPWSATSVNAVNATARLVRSRPDTGIPPLESIGR